MGWTLEHLYGRRSSKSPFPNSPKTSIHAWMVTIEISRLQLISILLPRTDPTSKVNLNGPWNVRKGETRRLSPHFGNGSEFLSKKGSDAHCDTSVLYIRSYTTHTTSNATPLGDTSPYAQSAWLIPLLPQVSCSAMSPFDPPGSRKGSDGRPVVVQTPTTRFGLFWAVIVRVNSNLLPPAIVSFG